MLAATLNGISFTDADVVNPEDFVPAGESNLYNIHGYLLYDHGLARAVVFAGCISHALDIAADAGKMEGFRVSKEDMGDYPNERGLSFLGNDCEPFDIELLSIEELVNPRFSFVALFNAR